MNELTTKEAMLERAADSLEEIDILLGTELDKKAPLDSPAFTGNPTAPTQAKWDNSTKLATDEFVQKQFLGTTDIENPVSYVNRSCSRNIFINTQNALDSAEFVTELIDVIKASAKTTDVNVCCFFNGAILSGALSGIEGFIQTQNKNGGYRYWQYQNPQKITCVRVNAGAVIDSYTIEGTLNS